MQIVAAIALVVFFAIVLNDMANQASSSGGGLGSIFAMKLTPFQIAGVAADAGFEGDDLTTAVAVALAESGGNPKAYNPEVAAGTPEGQGSFGLWQIYRKAHPEFDGQDLTDPATNAQAAYSVYVDAGSSFSPWSTYKNGAYLAHLDVAKGAVNV